MEKLRYFFLLALVTLLCSAFTLGVAPVWAEGHGGGAAKAEASKKEPEKKEEKKDGKKDKGDTDITGGKFDGDPIYVHLQPVLLPIITEQGAEQLVTVLIDVQVKSMGTADKMHTNMSRVKNTVFETLYGGFSDGSLRSGQSVNLHKMKIRLARALGKTVGPDAIDEVLIQAVAQRVL